MTDEERELLIDRLFYAEVDKYTNLVDIDPMILKDAANEIERLAEACAAWKKTADTWENLATLWKEQG